MKDYRTKEKIHESVLVNEVLEALGAHLKTQARYIDATLGTGGHSKALLATGGEVLGIDADREMLTIAQKRLAKYGRKIKFAKGNFRNIDKIAISEGFGQVDGIIFDLGTSNLQLTSPWRGFSFSNPTALLDMRLESETQAVTGADLLNGLREDQLRVLFGRVLPWYASRKLAAKVVRQREIKPLATVGDFLNVCQSIPGKKGLHVATLPFLALRMAVNSELENLEGGLAKAFGLLKPGGKLVVITFHSGEDRIVKNFGKATRGLTSQAPRLPSPQEIAENPRARSAKLRIIAKW